jgi:phage FluMu protein Com
MPIEFRCTQCGRLLRTQDDAIGKQAKCPQCGTIRTVPPVSEETSGGPPTGPMSPFAPSAGDAAEGTPFGAGYVEIHPTVISVGEILDRTWYILKSNYSTVLLLAIVFFGINGAVTGIHAAVNVGIEAAVRNGAPAALALHFPLFLAVFAFNIWLGIGLATAMLRVCRGQPAPLELLFSGGRCFLPVLGATILFTLIVLGAVLAVALTLGLLGAIVAAVGGREGMVLVGIVGGLVGLTVFFYVLLTFQQFYYLIVDRNAGVLEAFSLSRQIMQGNQLTLLLILIIAAVGSWIVTIFTCLIGLPFLVVPFFSLLLPVIYLSASGQVTIDQWDRPGAA